ncbi:MAG: DUF2693 domain-containing protein [Bacteroidaceae bacterium]|nr:DUF2693 domain-containing protein [Bacteroidaceae bacterium]
MSTRIKNEMRETMLLAWQFVKRNGYTIAEALRCAWANMKLRKAMASRIVRFYFHKVDGTIREAFGTLCESIVPPTLGTERRKNDTVSVYFDTEKGEWRCFKKANLMRVAI